MENAVYLSKSHVILSVHEVRVAKGDQCMLFSWSDFDITLNEKRISLAEHVSEKNKLFQLGHLLWRSMANPFPRVCLADASVYRFFRRAL